MSVYRISLRFSNLILASLVAGCSSYSATNVINVTDSGVPGGTGSSGGASNGGASSVGGTHAAAGSTSDATSAGGSSDTGGTKNAAGANATGGTSSAVGNSSTTLPSTGGTGAIGGTSSSAPTSVGGTSTGGTSSAAGATGGAPPTGGASTAGGNMTTGGVAPIGGATLTGGTKSTGGAPPTGGSKPTGGTSSIATGGAATGGAATGGAATGGAATGGAATGGAATGGMATGGMATGGTSACSGTTCSGNCVDLQSDTNNCGSCGASCGNLGCSAGQCGCTASTPNGTLCTRPGQVRGTCWSGACVLPAYFSGCNSAADCVPGGCTGPGGYCLGTVDVAGQVSCTANTGSYVVCSTSQGCSSGPSTGQVQCGDGNGGTGNATCDGPSDCPPNSDCCSYPGSGNNAHCAAQTTAGVIGSGCPSVGPGSQLPNLCDPLNSTANCPTGKTCSSVLGAGGEVVFLCQ